jgi:hypothetical protein
LRNPNVCGNAFRGSTAVVACMPEYHPSIPKGCPPDGAVCIEKTLYRGIKDLPLGEAAFLSHAEDPEATCDHSQCTSWGLSVWVTIADVRHAQSILGYTRYWAIAAGLVTPKDGALKKTPNAKQPNHHTFWKDCKVKLAGRFKIIQMPLKVRKS